jgi:hypothetical protein
MTFPKWYNRQHRTTCTVTASGGSACMRMLGCLVPILNDYLRTSLPDAQLIEYCSYFSLNLVLCPSYSDGFTTGYNFVSLIRASAVVKRHCTVVSLWLRRASQAAVSRISVG